MNPKLKKGIASGIAGIALISGGVDVGSYSGSKLQTQTIQVANEDIKIQQINDTVETIMPWKGEKGLTIKYDLGTPSLTEKFKDQRVKNIIAEKISNQDFKVDILLTEKPDTNVFCYTVEGYEDYDFFYQPPLTPQEIANGNYRAPEIEGSFAVYHKSKKGNQYQTGKVMHIPYPYVWEVGNESSKTRAEDFTFSNGQLCVVVPQTFLDSADYTNGVRIDPTFGYTSIGASTANAGTTGGVNNPTGLLGTLTEAGSISKITAYTSVTTGTSNIASKLFAGSAGSRGALIDTTNTTSNNTTPQWLDYTFASPYSGSATTYWLDYQGAGGGGPGTPVGRIAYDTGGGANTSYTTTDVGALVYGTDIFSIYATYTATVSNISTPISIKGSGKVEVKSGTVNIK